AVCGERIKSGGRPSKEQPPQKECEQMYSTPDDQDGKAAGGPPFDAEAIPQELRALPQWVPWKKAVRNNKATKLPIDPNTGLAAGTDDPTTWGTFDAAIEAAHRSGLAGVGFVFTAADDFYGIDLDGCYDSQTRELTPWGREIVESINSYTEV